MSASPKPASAGKNPFRPGCHAKPTEGENPGRQVPQVGARGSRFSPNRSGFADGTGNIVPPSDKANVPGASPKFTLPPQSAAGKK